MQEEVTQKTIALVIKTAKLDALAGADHSYEDHDAKGIKLKKGNIGKPYRNYISEPIDG